MTVLLMGELVGTVWTRNGSSESRSSPLPAVATEGEKSEVAGPMRPTGEGDSEGETPEAGV